MTGVELMFWFHFFLGSGLFLGYQFGKARYKRGKGEQ